MNINFKRIILIFLFFHIFLSLFCKTKALWVTPWDVNTEEKARRMVERASEWGITDLLVEVRYRGDTFYTPNKRHKTYPNTELKSYILGNNKSFDVLEYVLMCTRGKGMRVHAWVTVNVVTPTSLNQLPREHIYFRRNDWITYNSFNNQMNYDQYEGAYLDPGVREVQNYITNIFCDIVENYNIDGLHLDYIRYPFTNFGYHPESVSRFNGQKEIKDFELWKEQQIFDLVKKIGANVKSIKPHLIYSAAVMPNIDIARRHNSQNWHNWLDEKIIDNVYIMAYSTGNNTFKNVISAIPNKYRDKIVVGVRAWSDDGSYKLSSLIEKQEIIPNDFSGVCYFSYGGITQRNYQAALIENRRSIKIDGYVYGFNSKPLKGARIQNNADRSLFAISDENGYFVMNTFDLWDRSFTCSYMNYSQVASLIGTSPLSFSLSVFPTHIFDFNFSGVATENGILLYWDMPQETNISLYRKSLTLKENSKLISRMDPKINYFHDTQANLDHDYEYQLVRDLNLSSYTFLSNNHIMSKEQVDILVFYKNQNISIEIVNKSQSSFHWFLKNFQQSTLANGYLTKKTDTIFVPIEHLQRRFLVFQYLIDNVSFTKVIDLIEMVDKM